MQRTRKLPQVNHVSHLETHHAYISPPIPEKGGLPTIIVTPAEASSISEFEIHFYSPKPSQPTFTSSATSSATSQGFFPRMRLFFKQGAAPVPSAQAPDLLEKAGYFDDDDEGEEDIADNSAVPRISITGPSPARHGDYVALAQSEDDVEITQTIPGVPTISEEQWTAIRAAGSPLDLSTSASCTTLAGTHGHNHRLLTRRVRTLLFLSVPVALVAFHLITHQMGLFPSGAALDGVWSDESAGARPIGGPAL